MRKCRNCRGGLIRRNPAQLLVVGLIFCSSLSIAFFAPLFWVPGIILFVAGLYLIAWATLARGMWCRQCKTFSIHSED
ncbi:MAG TPA: hypothetical protein VGO61_16620 [Steroidobacteraceae bacterium]|nr:hypothetical protein [Steroidobacteraceae bacterium]